MNIFRSNSPDQDELMDRQQRQQMHASNLSQIDGDGNVDREYLRELTKHQVDEHTIALMSNMFSQDFVLSNLTDAEVTEVKWLARNIATKIKRMHPSEKSVAQGDARKVYMEDPNDGLKSLSPHQQNLVDQAVLDFITRPPRSRGGWQQDEVSKQVRVSKTEDDSEDSKRGSLFG